MIPDDQRPLPVVKSVTLFMERPISDVVQRFERQRYYPSKLRCVSTEVFYDNLERFGGSLRYYA